jgi:hypothetical protein
VHGCWPVLPPSAGTVPRQTCPRRFP